MPNDNLLGASFSIDVTSLKAGLAQANRLIRESESEFKAATAGMENYADSQEGLEARIKHLNNAQDLQKKKVKALEEQYKKLGYATDDMSAEAVKLRTDINKEKAALAATEKEIDKQTEALVELKKGTKAVAESAKDAGDGFTVMKGAAADLVSNGIQAVIGACTNAISTIAGLDEETREYRTELAKLQTTADAAGASTEYIKDKWHELGAVLGDEGAVAEGLNNLVSAGFTSEKAIDQITQHLEGAAIKWKDTLKFEGLADGLQETLATGKSVGPFSELLERAGVNLETFDEGLAKCKTSAEQQNYVLQQLSKLGLAEVSTAYREQNADLIAANKATTDYTDTQAELGEQIEPVTTAVKELKTEFIKGLTPAVEEVTPEIDGFIDRLKQDGTISKFSKGITNIVKSVLPPLTKVVKFAAENIEDLAKVTLTAVTVYKTFSAVMKVTTTITACTKAVKALSAGVSLATKTQVAWNTAMATNPIGAVLTAVGLLTTGIMLLTDTNKEAEYSTEMLSEEQEKAVPAALKAAEAYRETKAAADELAAASMVNLDYTKQLWGELQELASANGRVKDTDKARAEFILNELNNALGTEYSLNGNIIQSYKDMKKSIEDLIETKRAQILLEAYEESYAEAIKNVGEAEKARAQLAQEIYEQEQIVAQKELELAEAEIARSKARTREELEALDQVAHSKAQALNKEKALLTEKKKEYRETDAALQGYYANIDSYELASTAVLKGETQKAIGYLDDYGSGFQTAASLAKKSKDEQLAILRQQVIDTEVNLGILEAEYENAQGNMTDEEKKQAKLRIENAKKQAEDAKDEYYKVGGNMVEGMTKGAEDEEWTLTGALKKTVTNALNAAKEALGIESPSKVFRKEVGRQVPAGMALGVEDGTPKLVKTAKDQMKAVQKAFDAETVSANIQKTVSVNAPKTNGDTVSGSTQRNAVVNQYNYYSHSKSREELWQAKHDIAAAVKLQLLGV